MIRCQKCGQDNSNGSNFCRFCGIKFSHMRMQPQVQNQPEKPPSRRPYSWKTDEFQVKDNSVRNTQRINRVQSLGEVPNQTNRDIARQPVPQVTPFYQTGQQSNLATRDYRCPRCQTNLLPVVSKKVSTPGWVIFSILLVFTLVFFWIGLLFREEVHTCPVCNLRVN